MKNDTETWTPCDSREITSLARKVRARRQRRALGGAALLVGVSVLLLGMWLFPRADQGPDFAGISCERVMEVSDEYMKRQLPPELDAQVRRHIELCPNCRGMFENMPVASGLHFQSKRRTSRFWDLAQNNAHP